VKLLTGFNDTLKEKLLELHWRQWSTLGVSSYVKETKNIIDLEALIISSLLMGNYDNRLLSSCLEWIKNNKEWVSVSRIKQIGKYFSRVDPGLKKSLVPEALLECIPVLLTAGVQVKEFEKLDEQSIHWEYKNILLTLEDRGVTTAPVIQKYPLLQLYLRGIFGINARTEIFLFLVFEEKGNSNQIAREIYYDQKIVYRILKKWTASGFTSEEPREKETLYFLKTGRELAKNIKIRGRYVNWCRVFYFLSRLLTFASTEPWANDAYLLSSLFRDVSGEAARIGRYFNILLPENNLFKGENLFSPFAVALFKMLDKINE
jgi:hypothetical protein